MANKNFKVLFVHYRSGALDGVSLEIEKRAKVFKSLGGEVYYLTGFDPLHKKNVFLVPEIDLFNPLTKILYSFLFQKNPFVEKIAREVFNYSQKIIFDKFDKVFRKIKPDLVAVHNMFSHACNLAASGALLEVLDKYQPKTMVLNHDFWFEAKKYQNPQYDFVKNILKDLPPKRDYILKEQVINSFAQKELFLRRRIKAERIGDFFDFSNDILKKAEQKKGLNEVLKIKKNDFIVLHATRIAKRKAIENAFLFAKELKKEVRRNTPLKLLKKTITKDSNFYILFPNFVEEGEANYQQDLKELAKKYNLNILWAEDVFSLKEEKKSKLYSFWSSYLVADIVTYTSFWEGFGNQFLEAVYFKKPLVIFEYPVFLKDIKKEGYKYISLGREITRRNNLNFISQKTAKRAAKEMVAWIRGETLEKDLLLNFEIAKKYHSLKLLKKEFKQILKRLNESK